MFRMISILVSKEVELSSTLNLIFQLSLSFFPLAIPIAAFFATLYALNKLSEDSEVIALRSFGYTKEKLYWPFLQLSLAIGLSLFALYNDTIPKATGEFKDTVIQLTSSGILNSIKPGQFSTDIPNVTLFSEEVSEDGNAFKNIYINIKGKHGENEKVIMAKLGALIKIHRDAWSPPIIRLNLKDGNIINWNRSNNRIEKILFKEYDFPVVSNTASFVGADKDSMKSTSELKEIIKNKETQYHSKISSSEKFKDKADEKNFLKQLSKTKLEYYNRYLAGVQVVLFMFVAFSLGIKKRRGKVGNNTALGLIVIILYFVCYFFFVSLSNNGKIPPEISVLIPPTLLFLSGIYFFRKLDWAS